jgi:alpha-tubulin suppressor-like RCC1 family protein
LGGGQYSKISAGGATALAITTGGLLYGWGKITTDDNFYYNLGIDTITWGVGFSYRDINAGDSFIHAVRTDYSLWAYGLNASGQLGVNDTFTRSSPVQLGTNYSWSIIGNGISATPISAGALFLSGLNLNGQLGVNDTNNKSSPVVLSANPQLIFPYPVRIGTNRFVQVSAGNSYSMAIRDDYGLFAWGMNSNGQLGIGDTVNRSSPVQVSAGISWTQVSAGRDHTAAIRLDSTLYTWGLNTRGQLGSNTTVSRSAPAIVTGYWNSVAVGASHTAAIADDNTLYIWGDDNFGQ